MTDPAQALREFIREALASPDGIADGPLRDRAWKVLATPGCPQCRGEGTYLDWGGLSVACGCTEGKVQTAPHPDRNKHVRNQGVW